MTSYDYSNSYRRVVINQIPSSSILQSMKLVVPFMMPTIGCIVLMIDGDYDDHDRSAQSYSN